MKTPSSKELSPDDPICVNCGEFESSHALHGSWCPANDEDSKWSTKQRFSRQRVLTAGDIERIGEKAIEGGSAINRNPRRF